MTAAQLALLQQSQAQALIQAYSQAHPDQLALQLHARYPALAALVATQVGLLQRNADKLPAWVAAHCLLHPQAVQQASSQAAAALRFGGLAGRLAIDLTAGLGVDAVQLAHQFEQVIAVENDPLRVQLLQYNLGRLGVQNVQVVQAEGLAWLADYAGQQPDLLYIDPARRTSTHHKAVALHHCLPDLTGRSAWLASRAAQVCIKLSPLFDIHAAIKAFGKLSNLVVLSLADECKEVICWLQKDASEATHQAIMLRKTQQFVLEDIDHTPDIQLCQSGAYLIEPDVAVYKAGLWQAFFSTYLHRAGACHTSPYGYFLAAQPPNDIPARVLRIVSALPYSQHRVVKAYIQKHGLQKANLSKRLYPLTIDELRMRFKLADGGSDYLFFTDTGAGHLLLHCRY